MDANMSNWGDMCWSLELVCSEQFGWHECCYEKYNLLHPLVMEYATSDKQPIINHDLHFGGIFLTTMLEMRSIGFPPFPYKVLFQVNVYKWTVHGAQSTAQMESELTKSSDQCQSSEATGRPRHLNFSLAAERLSLEIWALAAKPLKPQTGVLGAYVTASSSQVLFAMAYCTHYHKLINNFRYQLKWNISPSPMSSYY